MNLSRRGFLGSILALGVAPAIVKAANLMPVFARAESGLLLPTRVDTLYGFGGNNILTIQAITAEALKILENQLTVQWSVQTRAYDAYSDIHMTRLVSK